MNFILGGRMGDLVHQLYVVKNTTGRHDLFITDRRDLHSDGFIYDLNKTIEELKPILLQQDYVNSVQPYDGPVTESTLGGWVNLNMWRRWVYSDSWTNLLAKVFGVPINGEPWIVLPKFPHWANNRTIFHNSVHEARQGRHCCSPPNSVFIGTTDEYRVSKRYMPHHLPKSLSEIFDIINNCGEFVGNQSMPLAIALSLGKKCTGILNQTDKVAYLGEEKIFKNFSYVL